MVEKKGTLYFCRGISMFPALRTGDRLFLGPAGTLARGDICVFNGPSGYIAHRFVREEGGALLMKGDALRGCERVEPERIVGRLRMVLRKEKILLPPKKRSLLSFLVQVSLPAFLRAGAVQPLRRIFRSALFR
jgi:hypothetical protein